MFPERVLLSVELESSGKAVWVIYQRRLMASQDDRVDTRVVLFEQNNLLDVMLREER